MKLEKPNIKYFIYAGDYEEVYMCDDSDELQERLKEMGDEGWDMDELMIYEAPGYYYYEVSEDLELIRKEVR